MGFKRSTVKVTGQESLFPPIQIRFQMITPVWINQLYSNFNLWLFTQRRPLFIMRSKAKVKQLFINLFINNHSSQNQLIVFQLHLCMIHHSRKIPMDFGFKRSKIKIIGQDCIQICFCIRTLV